MTGTDSGVVIPRKLRPSSGTGMEYMEGKKFFFMEWEGIEPSRYPLQSSSVAARIQEMAWVQEEQQGVNPSEVAETDIGWLNATSVACGMS